MIKEWFIATCRNTLKYEFEWVPHFWPILPEVGFLTSPRAPEVLCHSEAQSDESLP